MKKLILLFFAAIFTLNLSAQETETLESLKAMQAEKKAAADALKAEADALQARIDTYPGWKFGGLGVLGFNAFGNNAWYTIDAPYSSQNSLGLGFTAFANHDAKKTFWRNALTINMSKTNSKDNPDATEVETIADKLGINSLAGYKLSDKIALSAEGAYTSTVLNFNDPGQLTLSAGVTWTPITDLVVIIHPLGYQFNFPSGDFSSTPGAKIGAVYTKEIIPGVKWNTNLSAFLSYGKGDNTFNLDDDGNQFTIADGFSTAQMSNWVWENGLSFNAWKGIGVGINFGLAGNKQLTESYRFGLLQNGETDRNTDDNPLQSYWNAGLSYAF